MQIYYGKRFLKSAKKLPKDIKEKLAARVNILIKDPFHPQLHTKMLAGELTGFYSFRITRDWRVIFHFLGQEKIQLLLAGDRKDIYKKAKK